MLAPKVVDDRKDNSGARSGIRCVKHPPRPAAPSVAYRAHAPPTPRAAPMTRAPRPEIVRATGYEVHVVGAPRPGLRDLYHGLLRIPWWATLLVIAGGYLLLNVLFALAYLVTGGIAHAEPGSFSDAFFFSVQTMGTIGYGAMFPETRAANVVVVLESVTGLVATAFATGLVFVRFSQTRARVAFSSRVAVGPVDGVPTLMIRVGNERRGAIVGVHFELSVVRVTRTAEGVTFYRTEDLRLVRDRAPALVRSWHVQHRIGPDSPLHGLSPEALAESEAELTLQVHGMDDTSLQYIHGRYVWTAEAIVFGARLADVLSEMPDGNLRLDLGAFHELVPTAPTPEFPYPRDVV